MIQPNHPSPRIYILSSSLQSQSSLIIWFYNYMSLFSIELWSSPITSRLCAVLFLYIESYIKFIYLFIYLFNCFVPFSCSRRRYKSEYASNFQPPWMFKSTSGAWKLDQVKQHHDLL